jgi:RNA polymerase-binding transcription factor DksA
MKSNKPATRQTSPRNRRVPRAKATQVPRKWRWHYRVLQNLRDLLLDERSARLAEAAEPIEPHSMDPAESATDEFNHELAVSLLSGEQDALYEVDSAIRRILSNTYGVCEKTGKRIPMARLRAVPWTHFTKEAEDTIETEGGFHRIGLAKVSSVQGPKPGGLAQAEEAEKGELHARLVGRHQLAESLKTLEESDQVPPEELPQVNFRGTADRAKRRMTGRSDAQPKRGKSRHKSGRSS